MWNGNCYVGDGIQIEEMPQSCVISQVRDGKIYIVLVSSKDDAKSLIESLQRMLEDI